MPLNRRRRGIPTPNESPRLLRRCRRPSPVHTRHVAASEALKLDGRGLLSPRVHPIPPHTHADLNRPRGTCLDARAPQPRTRQKRLALALQPCRRLRLLCRHRLRLSHGGPSGRHRRALLRGPRPFLCLQPAYVEASA